MVWRNVYTKGKKKQPALLTKFRLLLSYKTTMGKQLPFADAATIGMLKTIQRVSLLL